MWYGFALTNRYAKKSYISDYIVEQNGEES